MDSYEKRVDGLALAYRASRSDEDFDALHRALKPNIELKARYWHIRGLDRADMVQEMTIVIWECIGTWEPERCPFARYFSMARHRKMATHLKHSQAMKNSVLNESIPYSLYFNSGDELDDPCAVPDPNAMDPGKPPEDAELMSEAHLLLRRALTDQEYGSVVCHASGLTLEESSDQLGISEKNIDNALYRARLKLDHLGLGRVAGADRFDLLREHNRMAGGPAPGPDPGVDMVPVSPNPNCPEFSAFRVSPEDHAWASAMKWYVTVSGPKGRATVYRRIPDDSKPNGERLSMLSREVARRAGADIRGRGQVISHRNGDRLDFRRDNLHVRRGISRKKLSGTYRTYRKKREQKNGD
jgi:RNA polymerase sigma factor (sigma-70 family)